MLLTFVTLTIKQQTQVEKLKKGNRWIRWKKGQNRTVHLSIFTMATSIYCIRLEKEYWWKNFYGFFNIFTLYIYKTAERKSHSNISITLVYCVPWIQFQYGWKIMLELCWTNYFSSNEQFQLFPVMKWNCFGSNSRSIRQC